MVIQKPLANCIGQTQEYIDNANVAVTIIWGRDRDKSETFGFNTETDKEMFLLGVDVSNGWLEYEIEGEDYE
tara:strand:- start:1288 stop:1503 length:216 start_codon:yes stop_codon:yes gene_type:complete